ncbi:hypothetical protein [Cytobacillus gottheilii]|uniref:hypothetical protein n=1 Tax=Cytobacillus gottheilii TaxID=859144 RepID=UPI0009BAD0EB|nr:hypothetical protein [Cytobacillus gottheilii]
MNQVSTDALNVRIEHIEEDIKEIKEEAKENNKYFRDVIDSLKENSIQQTEILRNQERQFTQVNNDIAGLRQEVQDSSKLHTTWYQSFLSDGFGKIIKIILIIILILSGASIAGVDVAKLITGI